MEKKNIIKAIENYREDGKKLMILLGLKFNLNINLKKDCEKLVYRNREEIPRSGGLSKRWNYSFHGNACGFYNKKYQQNVEVVLSNLPEFGHIDAWFLMSYMESTEIYKRTVEGFDYLELRKIVDELYKTGEVEYIE